MDGFGEVVLERKLTKEAIHQVDRMVVDDSSHTCVSVVGYDGENLYSTNMTDIVVHLSDHYGEPMPQLLLDPTDHDNGGDVDGISNINSFSTLSSTLVATFHSHHHSSVHSYLSIPVIYKQRYSASAYQHP
jgi:hypothetical protein